MKDLADVFSSLKNEIQQFDGKASLHATKKSDKGIELYGGKKVTVYNKTVDKMYFASAIQQKNFVGFYFFPIYTHPPHFSYVPAELKKCLKGKSCFHIKSADAGVMKQVNGILKKGYNLYKKEGWI